MLQRWDPFAEMVSMRDAMSRLFDESFVRPSGLLGAASTSVFPFDLYESADEVGLRAAIPGADPSQIELSVTQGILTVKGYRGFYSGDQEQQYTWHTRGLPEGNFQFTVALPAKVNADQAEASYEAGILWIRLPKAETAKPKKIAVKGTHPQEQLTAGAR